MSNEIQRAYNGADAYMLERSEEIHDRYLLDLADFTAFNTKFDSDFAQDWLDRIDDILVFKSDSTVRSEQKIKTGTVKQAMTACQKVHKAILFVAEEVLDKAIVRDEFGKGAKFDKIRNRQAKLSEFMDKFIGTVDKYKTELLAGGCPQATIDLVTTAANNLRSFNTDQNLTIDGRPAISKERVTELNAAYSPMALVNKAAKQIYAGDETKLGEYGYNPTIHHFPPSVVYKGTLAEGAQANVVSSGVDQTKTIIIANTSPKTSNAKFLVAVEADADTIGEDAVDFKPQERGVVLPEDIPMLPAYFINIKNLSTTHTATYRIRVRDAE